MCVCVKYTYTPHSLARCKALRSHLQNSWFDSRANHFPVIPAIIGTSVSLDYTENLEELTPIHLKGKQAYGKIQYVCVHTHTYIYISINHFLWYPRGCIRPR